MLGLNAVSDGHHVVLPAEATALAGQLAARGFEPVRVEMSEFRKAGLTMEAARKNCEVYKATLGAQQNIQYAIPSLEKAALLRPDDPAPHIFLSEIYDRLGREADAKQERERAINLGAVPKMQGPLAPDPKQPNSDN